MKRIKVYLAIFAITAATILLLCVAILAYPVIIGAEDKPPGYHMLRPEIVMTIREREPSLPGTAWVSNQNYHMTLLWFDWIPEGRWAATICAECTGPSDRAPMWIQVRALDKPWGLGNSYQSVTAGQWHVTWSDGAMLYVDGPGWTCVRLPAQVDHWQQVHNYGLGWIAMETSDGKTFRFRADRIILHLRRV